MEKESVIRTIMYKRSYRAGSVTGNLVEVIGEEVWQDNETGDHFDCYLYNIVGYTPENGKPFVALKENIIPIETIEEDRSPIDMGEPENHDAWEELRRLRARNVY